MDVTPTPKVKLTPVPSPRSAPRPSGRLVAGGMLRENTPVDDYREDWGLWVKREDKACPPPGPPFSKARGVYAWVAKQTTPIIGALDTYHSQAGHAVARACQVLGKKCLNFYPEFKGDPGPRPPQLAARALGAQLVPLPAGRSAVLFWRARAEATRRGGVMIPNALKLEESVEETAKEVPDDCSRYDNVLVSISSGTIAAGVIRGFDRKLNPFLRRRDAVRFLIHMGYTRSHEQVCRYLRETSGVPAATLILIDEEYQYRDESRPGPMPPWPCSPYYDLKTVRWWAEHRREYPGETLLWNIG